MIKTQQCDDSGLNEEREKKSRKEKIVERKKKHVLNAEREVA